MIGQTISHYQILEKLGEGGMGVVYKAQDTKLDRLVALKFLPSHLTASEEEKARFLQEAKAASALNHPGVCTIYGIEEHNGQQFIEMEYVDGATLESKIQRSGLKSQDAISYAIQIGEALVEAHSKGIIHRDIKSSNIMVNSKNQIKVMDFGLAKLKGSLKLTRTPSTIGTLAYMSPEQVQGGEADARSDIFSFGVVLYEMLAGQLPFRGEHEAAMMYSIVNEQPEPIEKYRAEISSELARIINRSLEKDPEDRYQHVDDMVSELRRVKKQSAKLTQPFVSFSPALPSDQKISEDAHPLPLTPIARPSKKNLWIGIIPTGVILVGIVGYLLFRSGVRETTTSDTGRKMLVVLPFENLGSPDQEYFADGITEEITSRLSGLSGLSVIARSSAMQYKKTTKTIREIGEELGVSYILQGTVRWETVDGTSRVRVNPQLIKVANGTQIWSQPSEAVLAGVFKLQSEIAAQVANALDVALLQPERKSLEAKLTDNAEAYDYYLRGISYLRRSYEERDYRIAEQMFQRAVELDPKFASAYAQLSTVNSNIYWEYYDHTEERVLKSKEAAEKALHLDPDLPEAHGAMGWYYYHGRLDYDNALKEFSLALERQPNNADVLLGIGAVERRQGKFEDAVANFRKALEIDPRFTTLNEDIAITYMYLRRYADTEQYFDRAISLTPDWAEPYSYKAQLYVNWEGNITKARSVLKQATDRKVGGQDPAFISMSVMIDVYEGKYENAAERLLGAPIKVFDDQTSFTPKELLLGRINGYMNRTQLEHAYYDSARIILERELQAHAEDARLHTALGIAYAGLGRKKDAVREGKRGVELLPISREALRGAVRAQDLAEIYTRVGEQEAAIDQLEQLLAIPSWLSVPLVRIDPVWNPLHGNPRFQKLISENK